MLFLVDEAKPVSSPVGAYNPVDVAAAHVRIFQGRSRTTTSEQSGFDFDFGGSSINDKGF